MGETGYDFSTILKFRLHSDTPLTLPDLGLDDAAFLILCQDNPEFRIERDATRQIIAMPPTSSER